MWAYDIPTPQPQWYYISGNFWSPIHLTPLPVAVAAEYPITYWV